MKPINKQTVKTPWKFVIVGILIGALIGAIFMGVFAQAPSSTFTISSGVYPGAPSYTVWNEGSEYFAKDANGLLAYSGTNASQIMQNVVTDGGIIKLKNGIYYFTNTVLVNLAGALIIEGESAHLDRFWPATSYQPNSGVVIIADGITAFEVGAETENSPIFTLKNVLITGKNPTLEPLGDTSYSAGAGVNLTSNVRMAELDNVQIHRKQYGIYADAGAGKCVARVDLNHVLLTYNYWGFYHQAYLLRYVNIKYLEGYINQRSLIKVNPSYGFWADIIDDEASSWNVEASSLDSPICLSILQDAHLSRVGIYGSKGTTPNPARCLLQLSMSTNATVHLNDIILTGSSDRGIYVYGSTDIYWFNLNQFLIGNLPYRGVTDSTQTGIYISNAMRGMVTNGQIYAGVPIENGTSLNFKLTNVWNGTAYLPDV